MDNQAAQVRVQRVQQTSAGNNSAGFFHRAINDITSAAEFSYGFAKGAATRISDDTYSIMDDIDHPFRTALMLYAAGESDDASLMHFAHELLHASTRPEALTQLKNDLHNIDHTIASDWTLALHNPEFAGKMVGEGVFVGASFLVGGEVAGVSKFGMFGDRAVLADRAITANRLIASSERISSDVVNKPFITDDAKAAGWNPPYPSGLSLRKITLSEETVFYRVFTDPMDTAGRFFAQQKEITPFLHDPEALRIHLGLPNAPMYITEVHVPADTEMYVGRINAQPNFGLMGRSGFQYQTIKWLPERCYVNTRLLLRPDSVLQF